MSHDYDVRDQDDHNHNEGRTKDRLTYLIHEPEYGFHNSVNHILEWEWRVIEQSIKPKF